MKKHIFTAALALLAAFSAKADEGMWLLPLLQQLNAGTMKEMGCRISPEEIYSINNASLKDAIVMFGGGCTGEMISDKGLLVTNHHCGYSYIQKLSSDEHNYLEDGFWAMNNKEEIPAPGLTVTFLVSMTDVTGKADDKESASALVEAAEADNPGCRAVVENFYNDNVQYLLVYRTYRDVRFVGAPPASIGKFGGETDNWMWPRHTGDFSMFRVYAGKDNMPADYSEDNVPYKPAKSLKISLKGVDEGDFTFIMGYPGSTQRFQTTSQLNHMLDKHSISIEARTVRQNIMWKWMDSDPSVRLKYANKYASSANGWKKWIGQEKAFADLGILAKEEEKEAAFMKWAGKKKERTEKYGDALELIDQGVKAIAQAEKDAVLLAESILNIELMGFPIHLKRGFQNGIASGLDTTAALDRAVNQLEARYNDYYEPLDREMALAMLEFYRTYAREENHISLGEDFDEMDFPALVEDLYSTSIFTSFDKLKAAVAEEGAYQAVMADKAALLAGSAMLVYSGILTNIDIEEAGKADTGSKAYTAGLLEWQKGKASYPDANFTMRLTYGTVKPYSPKDGLLYRHYTTIYGVIEKEDPDNYEFKVPAKLKELYQNKDYGKYAMADGNLPCCFLTNNDITGGNSGSPVLNADGNLVGLAFDGNWESMSSDIMFEPDLQRCICVDIRYVLFLMDKFGGAGYLLKEMDIVK
ncbi:MAG: S46 family peptidase [Candidatus Cryptobacteroides sp.]